MIKNSLRHSMGGKGNDGMFYESAPRICAAGVPSAQAEQSVAQSFKKYSLQDEVDALIHDAIIPEPKPLKQAPLRRDPLPDMRNAGLFGEAASLINPPMKTKFQTLVEDFKTTVYESYWNKVIGSVPDPIPKLPEGLDVVKTTFGKKRKDEGRLYDFILPKIPLPDKTPASKEPGRQTSRNYCKPFSRERTNGVRYNVDPRGVGVKCCLTDDRLILGKINIPLTARQADFIEASEPQLGEPLAPNDNIACVAPGYAFGILKPPDNLPECLTTCEMNPGRDLFKKCLGHLNTLRKCLKKRFDNPFFSKLYLQLKYFDKDKTGWLPKDFVYDFCSRRYIRFDPSLLEPLLGTLNGFDGSRVEYKIFVDMINHTIPTPDLPKVWDVPDSCIDFRTTYKEMVKPGQEIDRGLRAGLPSGRYFDLDFPVTPIRCCKADRTYLPEESDAKCCLSPSIFTLLGISHRDMYAKRTPAEVKKVFEASGETFTGDTFESIWNAAKNFHSEGWVCYETFRRALSKVNQ